MRTSSGAWEDDYPEAKRPRKLDAGQQFLARFFMIASAEGEAAAIAYANEYHASRKRRAAASSLEDPFMRTDGDMIDLLATGPLGGPETLDEEQWRLVLERPPYLRRRPVASASGWEQPVLLR